MKATTTPSRFDYGTLRVRDLGIRTQQLPNGKQAARLEIDGELLQPSRRFWTSFFHRFGVTDNVFRYFDHAEVFSRIADRAPSDLLRFCVERDAMGRGTLLAVSPLNRPIVSHLEITNLVRAYGGDGCSYDNGVVTSFHVPRSGESEFKIGGDAFQHRFVMDTPIDGYGNPKIHLSLLRLICANGAVGYSTAFRSELPVGKNINYSIMRALESYDNGDGFVALRQRFQSAQNSWASLYECHQLYNTLLKLVDRNELTSEAVLPSFSRITGNANALYGLANLDALTVKRQRVLPAKCRVYDLINFASELATHHARPGGNRVLQAFIGSLVSDEYDMEGTAEKLTDFDDFFMQHAPSSPAPSVN